jgi:hypothetical protein
VSSAPAPSRFHETSAAAQRATRLPKVSTGKGRDSGSLPIGVLLAADGAVQSASPGAASGGTDLSQAWGQPHASATPLPRREPRGPGRTERREVSPSPSRPLPRRRDLRAGGRVERPGGSWAPQAYPVARAHPEDAKTYPADPSASTRTAAQGFAAVPLPPGVVRLDDPSSADGTRPRPAADDTMLIGPRHDRATLLTDPNGIGRISRLMRPVPHGPTTGSLDIDADLFTPAAERLSRDTAAAGLPLATALGPGVTAGTAPMVYPRRRDLRRSGGAPVTGPIAVPAQVPAGESSVPAGSSFVPGQAGPAPCSGPIPLGTLPRRRDLRLGTVPPAAGAASEEGERERGAAERTGAIAVGVARAAVMTMLVGVGYAVVSGHQLMPDSGSDTVNPDTAGAMLAAGPASPSSSTAPKSDWDARSEVAQMKAVADQQAAQRAAAAQAAAVRVQAAKAAADARAAQLATVTRNAQRDPKSVARLLAADRGWGSTQFTCLDLLWTRESGWNYRATNASSGAYGIPQSLPGSKMGSVASDWRTNPVTQIKWGLNYIAGVYGTPCGAWAHSQRTGWY